MDALMLKNVSKAYENFQLKDISFTLPEGTIMGLIGENGAGKSTIINCIMDLVKRDSGEITVLGQQMDKDNLALREDMESFSMSVISMTASVLSIRKKFYRMFIKTGIMKPFKDTNNSLHYLIKSV